MSIIYKDVLKKIDDYFANTSKEKLFKDLKECGYEPKEKKMESIAKFFNHDFTNGPFYLYDKNGNEIYFEYLYGHWFKREYDRNGNRTYYEESNGFCFRKEFDKNGNEIYHENSRDGVIIDKRPCEDKVVEVDGKKYKLIPLQKIIKRMNKI